ncbi:Hypothetical predicted protein [Lecanosticta acicola]|uniref:Transmembrane protein n=1 Tax=Lecanosticta acicola TaxID=111012 RepID=A0AAI8YVR6_9PEZI|nr:Hypothetical predicted protein [Lecanosticta acicola]
MGRGGRSQQEEKTPLSSDIRVQPQAGTAPPPDQGQNGQSSQATQSRQSGQQKQRKNRKNEQWGDTSREPHYDSDKMREKPGTRKGALFRYYATQAEFYALPVAPGSEEVQLIQGEHWVFSSRDSRKGSETKWDTEKPHCVNENRRIWGNRIPWPTKQSIKTHYWYNMGFLAALYQNAGSIIFLASNLCRYKGLYAHLTTRAQEDGAVWAIKIVACALFTYSGLLNVWETQPKRTTLRPDLIGWWVGVFKVVGAIFFLVCSAFGPVYVHTAKTWAAISSAALALAGSSCFLLASLLLGFECSQPTPTIIIPLSDDEAQQYYQDRDNAAQANAIRDGALQQEILEMSGPLNPATQSSSAQAESPQHDGARPRERNVRDGDDPSQHIENGTSQGPQRHEARARRRLFKKKPERKEQQTQSVLEQVNGTGPSHGHSIPPLPELEAREIGRGDGDQADHVENRPPRRMYPLYD